MLDKTALSLSNWSLSHTLKLTSDPILKAQVIVFYFVFLFNFVKIGVLLPGYIQNDYFELIEGCVVGTLITLIALKLLLSFPSRVGALIHFALISSIAFMWPLLFRPNEEINVVTIQNVFMICMWSFYGLNSSWGIFYSIVGIAPVFFGAMIHEHTFNLGLPNTPIEASVTVIIANIVIILLGHYYYRNAIFKTLEEKGKLNEELEESDKAKTLFLSTMSHELRTPLNSVIGMANLLIDDNDDAEKKENLDILKFSAESLLSLINDILDFNKIGSGKVELETISFNLKALIGNVCAGLRIKAAEKNLYCTLQVDEELENQEVIGDPTRLLQIVNNLVGNAIKFTKKGGVSVQINLLKKESNTLSIRFMVVDTGLGITKEQEQYIFEPFTQASKNTTRKYGGTGLGLSIVKHLLTLHNSEIHLESEVDSGARFYFDIDYLASAKSVGTQLVTHQPEESFDSSGLHVLLAEDNLMSILFMKKLFLKWDISLDVVENGFEAVKALEKRDYSLILMDIHMPLMNGYEATKLIRMMTEPAKSAVHIIALTASVSIDIHLSAIEAGMNDSISKPFPAEELYQKIKVQCKSNQGTTCFNLPYE